MRYDDDFFCGVLVPQSLNRGHCAVGDTAESRGLSGLFRSSLAAARGSRMIFMRLLLRGQLMRMAP